MLWRKIKWVACPLGKCWEDDDLKGSILNDFSNFFDFINVCRRNVVRITLFICTIGHNNLLGYTAFWPLEGIVTFPFWYNRKENSSGSVDCVFWSTTPSANVKDIFFFFFFVYFFGGLECVGHSFAYVAHLWFLRDVWIRTQSAAVASWRATGLAIHPS